MNIILNKNNNFKFRFYTLLDSEIDKERLIYNAFYNSKQHQQQLTTLSQFAKVVINDDYNVYYKVNVIPYILGVAAPKVKQQNKSSKARPKTTHRANQGWEILDDKDFMEYNKSNYMPPGASNTSWKPLIKHGEYAHSNKHTYMPPGAPNKSWKPLIKHGEYVQSNMHTVKKEKRNKSLPQTEIKNSDQLFGWAPSVNHTDEILVDTTKPPPPITKRNKTNTPEVPATHTMTDGPTQRTPTPTTSGYSPNIKSIIDIAPLQAWKNDTLETHNRGTSPETPIDELIPNIITETINNMGFFKHLKCDTTLLTSAITSSLLSIGTSLHTLYTTKTTTTSKVLHSVAIISSLTTFCLSLHKLLDTFKVKHRTDHLYKELPELAREILTPKLKANSLSWIYPAISTLIAIIVGALTNFNICDVKSVIEKGRLLTTTKAMGNTANDITKFLLEDIAGLDITGDQKAFTELHDWAARTSELTVKSVMEFIQDPELNCEIHTVISTTIPIITNKYRNKDLSHAARSAFQLILTNVSKLQEKVEAMKIISDACKRVETIGVFFGGNKGVGKSRLCTYVANYIATTLGLPKTIYNLNKSKDTGFYGPYGGAAFAEIQEFMALKDQDPNLAHINQIISGDHFNLESAHLSGKQQPFNGRIVFLTSNNLCPDILRVLEKEAAKATWDRILRFEAIDDKVEGRTGSNLHRRPDFSHLKFNFVTSTDEFNASNITKRPVTIDEVLGIVLYQTAQREYQFITSGLSSEVLKPEDTTRRINFLKGIIDKNTRSNAGQDFNILRIEGPQFVGKTRIADQIASYVHGLLPTWPIVKTQQLESAIMTPKTPEVRGIYLIDDIIETNYSSYQLFLRWINAGHPDNLYIICSNHTYPQHWRRNILMYPTTKYWYIETHGCSSGIARRLGLEGDMQCSDGSKAHSSYRTTQVFIPKVGSIQHNNQEITLRTLKETTFAKFQDFLKCKEIITVQYENYTNTSYDFDCKVQLDTYEDVKRAFSSLTSVTQARLGLLKGVKIQFKTQLIPEIMRQFNSEKELLPGIVRCRESLIQQAEALSVILNRAIPGLSARFTIKSTGDDIILKDRVLYVGFNVTSNIFQVNHSASMQTIQATFQGDTTTITYQEYANFLKSGVIPTQMKHLQPELLSRLNMYVADNVKDSIFSYKTLLADIQIAKQQFVEQNFTTFVKNRPFIALITGLLALTTTGAIITVFSKAFTKPTNTISNSMPDENNLDPRISIFARQYKQAVLEGQDEARAIRAEVAKAGLSTQFNQWENDWRSNSYKTINTQLMLALETGNVKTILNLCELNPKAVSDTLKATYSNMLSARDEKHQNSGPLEQLTQKLRKNYVHVHSRMGNLYGIMVKGNLGITVAHCINHDTKEFQITSNGVTYNAAIHKVTRDRDLCTFRVTDKFFPSAADITQLFPTAGKMLDLTTGWYIRPTTRPLIVNAPIEYIDRHATPLMDSSNPFFRVEGRSWKYRLTGVASCANTFKIGDCGFPLIGSSDNNFYIIGIHNAFSTAGMGWFASVTQEDLTEITANSEPTRAALTIKHPLLNENMVIDDKMHSLVMTPYSTSVFENISPLKVHGYNSNLNFRSFPRHKKIFCDVAAKHLTCQTIGSALNDTHITDFTKLYKDRNGKYYPLFSQAVKYALSQQREETFDSAIDSHVSDYLTNYYKLTYPTGNILKPHEIINGLTHLKPLDMTTSAGPKMKKIFNISTKRPEGNENVLFVNTSTTKPWYAINTKSPAGSALLNDFSHYMSMIRQGKPICLIVKDNAKVELLPKEKVAQGKVRLFNEMDLSMNMVLKAYFGPMLEQVMQRHDTSMFCIGMNPYKDATAHMLYFNNMDGDFINADFESLDKTVTAHLITDFVKCTLPHVAPEARTALAKTLTYRLHTMNGNVYFVNNGNASGSFVTTLLNCHAVAKVTLYTFVKKFQEEFQRLPSYSEINDNVILRILGDDGLRKFRPIFAAPITQEELITDAARYRLKQTPAKTDGEVSFCSREYVKHKRIYFPRLKKSSITSCLFWFSTHEPEQIYQNCFTAIMEAGLWEEEFFTTVINAVIDLSKTFKFKIDLASHALVQECWYKYISGDSNTPVWGRSNPESIIGETDSTSSNSFKKMADMWLNEYVQKNRLEQPVYKYSAEGPDEDLRWTCNVNLIENNELLFGTGEGRDKSEAKRKACESVQIEITTNKSNVEIEWLCYKHKGEEFHVQKCIDQKAAKNDIFTSQVAFTRYIKANYPAIKFITEEGRLALMRTRCTTAIKTAIDGFVNNQLLPDLTKSIHNFSETLLESGNINDEEMGKLDALLSELENLQVRANIGDTPIEPAFMNQAMNAQTSADLPSQPNPQPTALAPAVTGPGDDIMSAIQIVQETTLNPMGAPNMLSVGAIGFDLKMLIYEQYMDCDQEFSTTESAPTGSIVLQIPYAVLSQFTNYYIQEYARMHKRYTGSIKFRVTGIGNQLLSGAVGVCWKEEKVNEATILISEAQKIAYEMKGVNNPFNEIHTLHDARQEKFYRNVADDLTEDLTTRPHLVVFVGMNIYNPYRDNTLVRFRIASKLANGREPNPFQLVLPTRRTTPAIEQSTSVAPAKAFDDVFTSTINTPIHIYTDGTLRRATDYKKGTSYPSYTPKAVNNAAYRYVNNGEFTRAAMTTATGATFTSAELAINWPSISSFFLTAGITPTESVVGIVSQSTMDSKNYSILTASAGYPGLGSYPANFSPKIVDWLYLKTILGWRIGTPNITFIPPNDIKILAILYNDAEIALGSFVANANYTYHYARFGQIKVVTNYGTTVYYLIATTTSTTPSAAQIRKNFGLLSEWQIAGTNTLASVKDAANYPNLNIDQSLGALPAFESLPLGYQALRFSDIPASALTIGDYPGPTATDDSCFERWFYQRSANLSPTSCIEMVLVDVTSQRIVATVRYFREWRLFVTNTETPNYRALPVTTENLVIQSIVEIERTNAFPITDTTLWFPRTSELASFNQNDLTPAHEFHLVCSNAALMMGAGALGGLGQGLNQMATRKHEKEMQSNTFGHELSMQGNMFEQQNLSQSNQFGHNERMATMNQEFQDMMQNNRFGQEKEVIGLQANEDRTTNKMQSQNRMTERGLGSRINFMNTSFATNA